MCFFRTLHNSYVVTLSDRHTKTNTCTNSVDPDEAARNEPSHQDLQCLPFSLLILLLLLLLLF